MSNTIKTLTYILTIVLFTSCLLKNENDSKIKLPYHCYSASQELSSFKTVLNKKVKAPQFHFPLDDVSGSIKRTTYKSDGNELQALIDTTNIELGKKKKALVYLHGGFALGYQDVLDCKKFTDNNYIVFAPSYRGENGNPGYYELMLGEVTDVKNSIKWLAKQEFINPDSIYVFGHSIGGGLSLSLSIHDDIPVLESGSCAGLYDISTFEYWHKENPDQVPFNYKDEAESVVRCPLYFLDCMHRSHHMYLGTEDNFEVFSEFIKSELYPNKELLMKLTEVEGDHFSSLNHSMDAFLNEIEVPDDI